jgi:multidrug efflux system outer membrane protein
VAPSALRQVESAPSNYARDLQRQARLGAARAQAASAFGDAQSLQAAGRSGALATLDAERTLASSDSGWETAG